MPDHSPVITTSRNNPVIRRARSLLRRKGRHEERAFLVEGTTIVADAIAAGAVPEVVFVRDDDDGHAWIARHGAQPWLRMVSSDVLASLTEQPHPQPVIGVFPIEAVTVEPLTDVWSAPLFLIADTISDPGNLGTLIRSAAGAGVSIVLVSPNSVDPFHPRCVRAAMGAHFLVSVHMASDAEIRDTLQGISLVVLADADGDQVYEDLPWHEPCAVIVGSEATGPTGHMRGLANAYVRIPLARTLESLNAGVAGSLLLFEAARQRRLASKARSADLGT